MPWRPCAARSSELIRAHDPYPAVVVDRGWDLVMANQGSQAFLDGVADHLLEPPGNSYRITLHPEGMAPRIVNFAGVGPPPAGHAAPPGRRDP